MDKLFQSRIKAFFLALALSYAQGIFAFELLSEGAMGSVSAVSANSAEEIVNVAGPTAAGLRVDDDDYEALPFQSSVTIDEGDTDDGSEELALELTQEVESWAENLRQKSSDGDFGSEVGYVDELPPSSFDDAVVYIRDDEFDQIIFEPSQEDDGSRTIYELGRIEQAITVLEQDIDSVRYVVERRVDFIATIDAYIGDPDTASMGSSYISDLHGRSNVRIAAIKD